MPNTDDIKDLITFISVVDNNIWFYAMIDVDSCHLLNKTLRELDIKLNSQHHSATASHQDKVKPIIHLHVQSYGGSILSAFSTIDTIRTLNSSVYTYVEGAVASAGTLITCVGEKRFIGKYSYMMVHQLSTTHEGKLAEVEDDIQNARQFMEMIKTLYKRYTKMTTKKMETLFKSDLWMDANQCLDLGLIDVIL